MSVKKLFYDNFGLRDWVIISIPPAVAILFLGFLIFGVDSYERWKCNNYSEVAGFEVNYISFDGCYVKTAKGWIKYDRNIRINFDGEL